MQVLQTHNGRGSGRRVRLDEYLDFSSRKYKPYKIGSKECRECRRYVEEVHLAVEYPMAAV